MQTSFDLQLEKYAQVIVRVGLNLQPGQRLLIAAGGPVSGVPLEAYPLVRKVAELAYKSGAVYVGVNWDDEELQRIRVQHAALETMDEYPTWKRDAAVEYLDNGDAIMTIHSRNPDLMDGLDAEKVRLKQRSESIAGQPVNERVTKSVTNWLVAAASMGTWARKLFPDMTADEAKSQLWALIFAACRVDQPDPVASWQQHLAELAKRTDYLNARRYAALKYRAPGTDLTVGLADGHIWLGGGLTSRNDIYFVPNLPTEEVFTMPHKHRIDGVVQATKPLSYGGSLIDDFSLHFENGRVVNAAAKVGQHTLDTLLDTDEGSRSLGEVALVPHSSPISQSGVLFYNTLFDENASCHLALGQAYRMTMQDSGEKSDDDYDSAGGNVSLSHSDFMIGSADMDIDGTNADGMAEAVMRQGEWAFSV